MVEVTDKFGQSLVIVASQYLRGKAPIEGSRSPTCELPILQYCLLERVKRARYVGEMTVIKNNIKDDPKSLFYLRKTLINQNLLEKQAFCIPNVDKKSAGII